MFEHVIEVLQTANRILVKVSLTRIHSNTLEDFNTQSATSNGTDHIDCVAFTAHVVSPGVEDVAALLNVHVVLVAVSESLKRLVEVLFGLVSCISLVLKFALELVLLTFLIF